MHISWAYFQHSFGILKFGSVASSALFPFCPNPITFFCQPTADSSHYTTMYCRSILCSVTVLVHTILPILLYTWLDLGTYYYDSREIRGISTRSNRILKNTARIVKFLSGTKYQNFLFYHFYLDALGAIHKQRRPIFQNLWPPFLYLSAQITK